MTQRTEQEIMQNWQALDKPIVSICCATYNHASYIAKAIDSFLIQETDFPFEIIIRDDCSTDRTAEIIKTYTEKFPKIVKPIFETENKFKSGQRPMPVIHKKAKGKYIALCEGDDYWTDPLKLQKQVNFLEKHDEYSISYHDVNLVNNTGKIISNSYNGKMQDFSEDEMLSGDAPILTGTALFRNIGSPLFPEIFDKVANGDMTLWHMLGFHGKGKFQKEVMNSCYRIHPGGVWSSIGDEGRIQKTIDTLYLLKKNLPVDKSYLASRIQNKIDHYYSNVLYHSLKKFEYTTYLKHLFKICSSRSINTVSVLKHHFVHLVQIIQNKV